MRAVFSPSFTDERSEFIKIKPLPRLAYIKSCNQESVLPFILLSYLQSMLFSDRKEGKEHRDSIEACYEVKENKKGKGDVKGA